MRSFVHELPDTLVVFGPGAEAHVGEHLDGRVLLVCTARHRAGADRVAAALGDRCVGVLDTAAPQVPGATADACGGARPRPERGLDRRSRWGHGHRVGQGHGAAAGRPNRRDSHDLLGLRDDQHLRDHPGRREDHRTRRPGPTESGSSTTPSWSWGCGSRSRGPRCSTPWRTRSTPCSTRTQR